jgi:hypothetical protein
VAQARVLLRLVYDEAMRRGGVRRRRAVKVHVLADQILDELDDQPRIYQSDQQVRRHR